MVHHHSRDQFQLLALKLAGHSDETIERTSPATDANRLKDFCYAGKTTLETLHLDVQDPSLGEHRISKPNPAEFTHALCFLKKYPTAHDLAGRCGVTEKTVLEKAWRCINAIHALKEKKIRWIFDENLQECFILSVDGVHCRIHEPRTQPSSGWCSKKFNKAGLVYELGVATHHDNIVWINGPFPAGQNDMKVFRKALINKIPDNRRAMGDEGHRGEPGKASTKNEFNSDEMKQFASRVRARHETVNSRLKAFAILDQTFRSKGKNAMMTKHKMAFEACCVIVQYELENGGALFRVQMRRRCPCATP